MFSNKRKLLLKLTAMMLLISMFCTGCSIGNRKVFFASKSGWHTVFKISDMSCSQKEAKVYLANYKNLYGNLYGTDLWNDGYSTTQMEQSLKDAVITHLTKVYALNVYAHDEGITLDESENKKIEEAAKKYYESLSRAEKSYTKASKKDIQHMYERYALAEKVYVQIMNGVDENVSEDEARVMEALVLYVKDESLAKQIESKLKDGATFERLASTYNEKDSIHATFGRGTYSSEVEDVVFQLDNEEHTKKIPADDGYYFFECVNKYNVELSEENKTKIIQKRQTQALEDVIKNQEEKYYSDFNNSLWDKIKIDGNEKIATDSFFSTLDEYIKY